MNTLERNSGVGNIKIEIRKFQKTFDARITVLTVHRKSCPGAATHLQLSYLRIPALNSRID